MMSGAGEVHVTQTFSPSHTVRFSVWSRDSVGRRDGTYEWDEEGAACNDSTFEWAEEGAACSGQDSAIPNR